MQKEPEKTNEEINIICLSQNKSKNKKTYINISDNLSVKSFYELIIKNRDIVNITDEKQQTFLSYAIKRKNDKIINLIIASPNLDLNFQDDYGNSYLHLAVFYNNFPLIGTLLIKGINLNIQNNNGDTALHLAYLVNNDDIINLLLNNDIDFNLKNKQGYIAEELKPNSENEKILNFNNLDEDNQNNETIDIDWDIFNNVQISKINGKNIICLSDDGPVRRSFIENRKKINNSVEENNFNSTKSNSVKVSKNLQMGETNTGAFELSSNLTLGKNQDNKLDYSNNIIENNEPKNNNKKENEKNKLYSDEDCLNFFRLESKEFNCKHKVSNADSLFNEIDTLENRNFFKNFEMVNSSVNLSAIGVKYDYEKSPLTNIRKPNEKLLKGLNKQQGLYNNDNYPFDRKSSIYNEYKELLVKDNKGTKTNLPKIEEKGNIEEQNLSQALVNEKNYDINNNNDNNNVNGLLNSKETIEKDSSNINISNNMGINNNFMRKFNINTLDLNDMTDNTPLDDINEELENKVIDQDIYINDKNEKSKLNKNKDIYIKIASSDNEIWDKPAIFNDKINKPLLEFLIQINMKKYYNNLNSNGFGDINFIIEETKDGVAITDLQLKQTGVNKAGDRAKILIKIQEKANNFECSLPKAVYYIRNFNPDLDQIDNDINLNTLYNWLKKIKMENYFRNFILNGYFSLDLLLVQTFSKNPLNDNILEEIGIDKLGYRARILNKLKEESKSYYKKIKSSVLIINNNENLKLCGGDCLIY